MCPGQDQARRLPLKHSSGVLTGEWLQVPGCSLANGSKFQVAHWRMAPSSGLLTGEWLQVPGCSLANGSKTKLCIVESMGFTNLASLGRNAVEGQSHAWDCRGIALRAPWGAPAGRGRRSTSIERTGHKVKGEEQLYVLLVATEAQLMRGVFGKSAKAVAKTLPCRESAYTKDYSLSHQAKHSTNFWSLFRCSNPSQMDCVAALSTASLVLELIKIAQLATKQIHALTVSIKDAHRLRIIWNAEKLLSSLEVDLAELRQAVRPEGDMPVSTSADVVKQLRLVSHERIGFWSSRLKDPEILLKDFFEPSSCTKAWPECQKRKRSGNVMWRSAYSDRESVGSQFGSLGAYDTHMSEQSSIFQDDVSEPVASPSCTSIQPHFWEHEGWETSRDGFPIALCFSESGSLPCSLSSCGSLFTEDSHTRTGNSRRHLESTHGHPRFECELCKASYNRADNLTHHVRKHHPEQLKRPCKRRRAKDDAQSLICAECRLPFQSLEAHAKAMNHRAFSCGFENCSSSFGRRDLLLRHELTHTDETNYPCPHCDKYSGENGFKRKDHLQQHLSNFHNKELYPKFCDHTDCQVKAIAVPQKAFESMKEYRTHLREVHDQTPFPCDWPGCERKGRKGYSRERDLEAHKKTHQQAITPLCTPPDNGHDSVITESATSWPTHMEWPLGKWIGSEDQGKIPDVQQFHEDIDSILGNVPAWNSLWD
ncbi:hypothetical protein E2P81_ATG05904 [Venturia nashicola]|nr:hypothetical protein E2P81_ATG05904 [Venturia nashicola]